MSILIKGVEMPRSCNECPMSVDGYCVVSPKKPNGDALNRHETTLWCPLIEIPQHGRLIDADALMSTIKEHDYLLYDRLTDTTKPGMFTFGVGYAVCTAPTIIEEE